MTTNAESTPEPVDDPKRGRFTITEDRAVAELDYAVRDGRLLILHTEVPAAFRGRGIGARLVAAAVTKAANDGLTIVPWCPFARRWLLEDPDRAGSVPVDFETPPPMA